MKCKRTDRFEDCFSITLIMMGCISFAIGQIVNYLIQTIYNVEHIVPMVMIIAGIMFIMIGCAFFIAGVSIEL